MSRPSAENSIAVKVDECLRAFKSLRGQLTASVEEALRAFNLLRGYIDVPLEHNVSAAKEELTDVLGRFRVWAGNIAAHRTGQSSLDHRLRDASELKGTVLNYLDELSEILKNGKQFRL